MIWIVALLCDENWLWPTCGSFYCPVMSWSWSVGGREGYKQYQEDQAVSHLPGTHIMTTGKLGNTTFSPHSVLLSKSCPTGAVLCLVWLTVTGASPGDSDQDLQQIVQDVQDTETGHMVEQLVHMIQDPR